jgi:hypothetical protein
MSRIWHGSAPRSVLQRETDSFDDSTMCENAIQLDMSTLSSQVV